MNTGEKITEQIYWLFKEDLLRLIVYNSYDDNYIGINFEIQARCNGTLLLEQLLSNKFPNMVNCVQYNKDIYLKCEV